MNKRMSGAGRLLAASALALVLTTSLQACGGGSSSGGNGNVSVSPPPPPPPVSPPPPPPPPTQSSVTVSGVATYDFVPFNTVTNGLDYAATEQRPIRGAVIELLNSSGGVLATDTTTDSGAYSFADITADTDARVSIKSQLLSTAASSYDISIVDNTSNDAVYAVQGSLTSVGTADQTRDLNAGSGFSAAGAATGTRAAAPFAIMDSIYESVTDFQGVNPDIDFPKLNVYWSTNNRPVGGDVTQGEIGTSSYTRLDLDGNGSFEQPTLLILGADDNDTDEYDKHVIVHEFGHYFEDQLSRSDSIGGSHTLSDRLDPRVAFGEGFGNALSGMILDDPFYRDSFGSNQTQGFDINVEGDNAPNRGWFNEASIQEILYDLYDSDDDGADTVSLGLEPIFNVLTSESYRDGRPFTTIFPFLDALAAEPGVNVADINALKTAQSINGTGPLGAGETNDGNIPNSLPVFKTVSTDGTPVTICSSNDAGTPNKLNNFDFVYVTIPTAGNYTFTMTRTSGATSTDPDFFIFTDDGFRFVADSADNNTETIRVSLTARDYSISARDFNNAQGTGQNSCYSFTVQP